MNAVHPVDSIVFERRDREPGGFTQPAFESWQAFATAVDGQTVDLGRIEIVLKVDGPRIIGMPTERGKRSEAYQRLEKGIGGGVTWLWVRELPSPLWDQVAQRIKRLAMTA